MPPNCWCLGKIVQVFKGSDNLVRVAKVKVGNKVIERPIAKL